MFCHKCGTQLSEGADFCHICGTKRNVPVTSVPSASTLDVLEVKKRLVDTLAQIKLLIEAQNKSDNPQASSAKPDIDPSDDISSKKSEPKDAQIENIKSTGQFILFGNTGSIPRDLANFNVLRHIYEKQKVKISAEFTARYKRLGSIEQVLNECPVICDELMFSVINLAVKDLISNKVYDVDPEKFFEYHKKRLRIGKALMKIESQYEDILEDQAEKNADRTSRRQSRSRWVGGGFGMEGAIKGAVQAGVLNAGSGLLHGTANVIGSAFTAVGTAGKKYSLFANPNTFDCLHTAIVADCGDVLLTLVEIFQKNGEDIEAITNDDKNAARVMFNNLSNPSFPKAERLETAVNAILRNPYEEKYYFYLINEFGDENNEVKALAGFFYIKTDHYKESLVREHFKKLPVSTLDEALSAKDNIENVCIRLGGVPNVILKELEDIIEDRKYKRIYEKYAAYPKSSIAEWDYCRAQICSLCEQLQVADGGKKIITEIDKSIFDFKVELANRFLAPLPKDTEEDAIAAKVRLLEYCKEIDLTQNNPTIKEIDGIIRQIDTSIRTVEGCEFDSREKARKAKAEKEAIDALLGGRAPVCRSDYMFLLDYLRDHAITPELKEIYQSRCDGALRRFGKLANRALAYEYRQTSRLGLLGGNKKGVITHTVVYSIAFILSLATLGLGFLVTMPGITIWEIVKRRGEKKAWNELTHEGQYDLNAVLDPQANKSISAATVPYAVDGADEAPENRFEIKASTLLNRKNTLIPAVLIPPVACVSLLAILGIVGMAMMEDSGNIAEPASGGVDIQAAGGAASSSMAGGEISDSSEGLASNATEADLRKLLEDAMPDEILTFSYGDYDGDGSFEAFAISYADQYDGLYSNVQIWFANKDGTAMVEEDLNGFPADAVTADGKSYFVWEFSAGGSGSSSVIYGVKNGAPYEPAISRQYMQFGYRDGAMKGLKSDFSKGYHDYIEFVFIHDSSIGEFSLSDNPSRSTNSAISRDARIDSLCESLEAYYKNYLLSINQQDISYITNAAPEQTERLKNRVFGINKDDIFTFDQIIIDLDSVEFLDSEMTIARFYAVFQFSTAPRSGGAKESGANIQIVDMEYDYDTYEWYVVNSEIVTDVLISNNQRVINTDERNTYSENDTADSRFIGTYANTGNSSEYMEFYDEKNVILHSDGNPSIYGTYINIDNILVVTFDFGAYYSDELFRLEENKIYYQSNNSNFYDYLNRRVIYNSSGAEDIVFVKK